MIDRFLSGQIQPMTLAGGLEWMGLTPEVMGDDAYEYRWAAELELVPLQWLDVRFRA